MTRYKPTNHGWLLALLVIFLISIFRIHAIHTTYMRDDEEIAYRTTSRDLIYAVRYQAFDDIQAPLWFAAFWGWQQVAGDSEFAARFSGVLLSMLTLALMYQMGRRWFGHWRYGVFALAVLGVNTYFHIYTLEIRPYPLVLLSAALCMWFFWRWLELGTRRAAVFYGLSIALMLYTHYFTVFLVMAQAIFVLFTVLRRGVQLNAPTGHPIKNIIPQAIFAALTAFLVWLPWSWVFIDQINTLRQIESEFGNTRGLGIATTTEPSTLPTILDLLYFSTNGQIALYALVLVLSLAFALWRKKGFWLAFLWAIGVPAIALTINLIAAVYTQRYLSYMSLGVGLLMGAALAVMIPRLREVMLFAFLGFSLWGLPAQLPLHTPYRDLFQRMTAASEPGDVVLFDKGGSGDSVIKWQYGHYLSPQLQANILTQEEALEKRRLWYITGEWFDDEVQANFKAIERTHPVQDVLGRCDRDWCYLIQLMEAPPLASPQVFGDELPFWGADVEQVRPERIEARLWWKVNQILDADYSISLQLLDANGALVAQTDGPINHYNSQIFQTSQLEPDKIYIDHRALIPAAPLPPGSYQLLLVVYQPWDGARLQLSDGSDVLPLDTLTVP
jgi:hypothetical protein